MAIEQMYRVSEIAEITTLSEDTAWQMFRTGRLVRTKTGGRTVVRESELRKLIQDQENNVQQQKKRTLRSAK